MGGRWLELTRQEVSHRQNSDRSQAQRKDAARKREGKRDGGKVRARGHGTLARYKKGKGAKSFQGKGEVAPARPKKKGEKRPYRLS